MATENYASSTELPKSQRYFGEVVENASRKTRYCAKKLHEMGYIYALYGALDGLSLSYSTLKYFFDVFFTNSGFSSSDVMHTWMMTPTGIAVAATESITIIVFSLLANVLDDKSSNLFKKYTVVMWPYVRDVMTSLKNSYKGVRSTITVINLLGGSGGVNLNFLMLPVGLLLGCLSVLNRLAFRSIIESRKDMMKANKSALAEIKQTTFLSPEDCERYRQEMMRQSQSMAARCAGYLSQAYSGVVDSLYLYVGVLVLGPCSLAPPALLAMSIFCVMYSLANVVARLYEEFDNQQKLLIRHAKIDLQLYGKEHGLTMQSDFAALHQLQKQILSPENLKNPELLTRLQEEQTQLASKILSKIAIFTQKRDYLKALSHTSFTSAFFLGIKNGLHAYGALNSAIVALATVLLLCSTTFPAVLLIAAISTGMALLIVFVSGTLYSTYRQRVKQQAIEDKPYDSLYNRLAVLKEVSVSGNPLDDSYSEGVNDIISRSLVLDASPQYAVQEGAEVVRSLCSGLPKGNRAVEFTWNPLQKIDASGHCHDTPIMFVLSAFSAVIYAITMALRAFARGFGRSPLDQDDPVPAVAVVSEVVAEEDPNNDASPEESPVVSSEMFEVVEIVSGALKESSVKEPEISPPAPPSSSPKPSRSSSCPQLFFSPAPSSPPRSATAPIPIDLVECHTLLSITLG